MDGLNGVPWLQAMARVFRQAGAPLYAVGGAVRNPLMGLPVSDVDVCGPARPEEVLAFCQGTPVQARARAAHFGTVELFATDGTGARHMAEYTTFREDSYRTGHRPERVRFAQSLEVDALRRDFSVNALYRALTPEGAEAVEDPTGGLEHLQRRVLHTVTPNPDRVLGEDGLRILRAARFRAELALTPTPELAQSLRRNAPLLKDIAPERMRDELEKTLLADVRYPGVGDGRAGLRLMAQCGAWALVTGGAAWDEAAVEALGCDKTLSGRAALLFYASGPGQAARVLTALRFSSRDARRAEALAQALRAVREGGLDRFEAARMGREAMVFAQNACRALRDALALARAQALLSDLEGAPASLKELAVDGDDLKPVLAQSGLPAQRMGRLLETLWRRAVLGETPNERSALLRDARRLAKEESAHGQ